MNTEQEKVVSLLKAGSNVLMLGSAGTGKSFIIEKIKQLLPEKKIFLTSTTGISALNIGGSTVHSFFGIGLGDKPTEKLLAKIRRNPDIVKKLKLENLLVVVDEVSMLPDELLTKLDSILKRLRRNFDKPFGGVQLLFSGDFLQLETINATNILDNELIKDFSKVILTQNYRQQGDLEFQNLLGRLRINQLTDNDDLILKKTSENILDDNTVRLFCINSKVTNYNTEKFNSIPGEIHKFTAKITGKCDKSLQELKKQFSSKNMDTLELKKGTRVMLTWNVDTESGLVNGSTGTVKDFIRNGVLVTFDKVGDFLIEKQEWCITDDSERPLAKSQQIPLMVSYALSIHKCQGITLTNAIIDLSQAFCNHQVYVALSRVRNLSGVKLVNYSKNKVKVNKDILKFYNDLEK